MFRGGFSFAYSASRWPFAKLKTVKIRFSMSGNEAHIPVRENKNRKFFFIKPTFACFREVKYPRNIRHVQYLAKPLKVVLLLLLLQKVQRINKWNFSNKEQEILLL